MYICYLDESGTANKTDTQSINFVYAGLAIPANSWKAKDNDISTIKAAHGLDGAEIHTAWLLRKYVEQVKLPDFESLTHAERRNRVKQLRLSHLNSLDIAGKTSNKNDVLKFYRATEPYIHLTYQERFDFIKSICYCIREWRDSRIFFHAIKKAGYDDSHSHVGGIFEDAFCQIITRFQSFLQNISHTGNEQYGLLVADNNQSIQIKLTTLTRGFHQRGAFWRDIPNIVETPLFVDSKQTGMIQLADVVSYSLRRYFDANEDALLSILWSRFGWHRGKMETGRHFTPQENCGCKICALVARQHIGRRASRPRPRS